MTCTVVLAVALVCVLHRNVYFVHILTFVHCHVALSCLLCRNMLAHIKLSFSLLYGDNVVKKIGMLSEYLALSDVWLKRTVAMLSITFNVFHMYDDVCRFTML
jgi:hypothetical protein